MFKFLRKGLEKLGIIQPKAPVARRRPASIPVPSRPPVSPTKQYGSRIVTNHIKDLFPHANVSNVRNRIKYMTPQEIIWTKNANKSSIQNKARGLPDREDDMGLPLNPWWYK